MDEGLECFLHLRRREKMYLLTIRLPVSIFEMTSNDHFGESALFGEYFSFHFFFENVFLSIHFVGFLFRYILLCYTWYSISGILGIYLVYTQVCGILKNKKNNNKKK